MWLGFKVQSWLILEGNLRKVYTKVAMLPKYNNLYSYVSNFPSLVKVFTNSRKLGPALQQIR
jgi:hypothetical protein